VHEDHQKEQYFFDPPTVQRLADRLANYDNPCCLCSPMIARELAARGRPARLLEIDDRFAEVPGFVPWDLYRPQHLDERFDAILVDPPFHKVRLSQLFTALRTLCHGDLNTPIFLCHLESRAADVCGTLAPFGMLSTDTMIGYVSVKPIPENRVCLYTNTGG
jgi:hypothetical protein